jgi:hypothetical protein
MKTKLPNEMGTYWQGFTDGYVTGVLVVMALIEGIPTKKVVKRKR